MDIVKYKADVTRFKRDMMAQTPPVPFGVDMLRTISEDDYARAKLHVEITPEKQRTATTIVRTNSLLLVSVLALVGMGLMADEIIPPKPTSLATRSISTSPRENYTGGLSPMHAGRV